MQRNPHSYQIATGYRTFNSLSLIYQPITKKRLFLIKNFAEDENRDESLFYRHIFIHSFRVEHPEFPFFVRIYEACVEVGV